MAKRGRVAKFAEYDDELFRLYTSCRYNELICHELMSGAARLERLNRTSVLISLTISLVAGALGFLNSPYFVWPWAIFGILATLLSIYSLIVDSGGKRFSWFGLATKLHAIADEVEQFSAYVRRGKITEPELLIEWKSFSRKLAELIEQGGVELREYEARHGEVLRNRLASILRHENRAAKRPNSG